MTTSTAMPAVYLPHGGGPAFFMRGPMADMFQPMAEFLASIDTLLPATPSALLVVTAHWEAPVATLTGGPSPELIFDYYGFPPETYQLTYPASGLPSLATEAARLLATAGIQVRVDAEHGWDHGVFIPLKVMYPEARIPVVAMSLQVGLDAAAHMAMGEALRPLREQGVLIVGSGMSFHNLSRFDRGGHDAAAFDAWLDGALAGDGNHRRRELARWATAESGRAAHPREEHLIPLMVASGAGGDEPATKLWSGLVGDTRVSGWSFP